ncbi:O-antigen ligase [Ruminococcaceae bacterium R-25]|nr:O-antigen ligase [Ruminococcaceae bacterium R-25]SUQ11284.1 O-antigen ligase [Oscillospiraceae bacterium]
MDILTYLQLFASITHAIILFFLPGLVSYKTYVIFLVALTALSILVFIIRRKGKVPIIFGIIFLVYAAVIGLYALVTPAMYPILQESNYMGSLLCLAGQILPNGLFACFVAEDEQLQVKVKRLAPLVGTVFAIIALICTLHPTLVTSGGLMDNENGLDYQRVSYMAAYSAAMMEYYLLTRHTEVHFLFFKNKLGLVVSGIVIFLDLLVTLISGGRGGFVTFIVFFIISIFLAYRFGLYQNYKVLRVLLVGLIALIGVYAANWFVLKSSVSTSGYGRIISMIKGAGDIRRLAKIETAIDTFIQKPIWGHGFGSVYLEFGQYTHNFFTDILVEGGLVLTIIAILFLFYCFVSSIRLIRLDNSDLIWFYFFLCGFTLSMFSGYYLTQIPLWWGLSFVVAKNFWIRKNAGVEKAESDSNTENIVQDSFDNVDNAESDNNG